MQQRCVTIFIQGSVHGVGFRNAARATARSLGLVGYVRNSPNGGVECTVQGDPLGVEGMIQWCHTGTAHSTIESVEVEESEKTQPFSRFEIR